MAKLNELYNRIEALCASAGVNITMMCREAGVTRGNLTDLKMGRTASLGAKNLQKLASYFGVTVDYLITGQGSPPGPYTRLNIPESLREARVAFDRGEFMDLTQDEVDALAVIAETMKKARNQAKLDSLPREEAE